MEHGPFEDVFPIKHGIFHCYVSLLEGRHFMYFCPSFVHSRSRVATAGTQGVSRMPWVFVDHVLPSTQPARVWAQPRTVLLEFGKKPIGTIL